MHSHCTDLGNKIKFFRIREGLSQFELELEIETSPGRISKIESGRINPDKETIINIAKALKLRTPEVAALFGIEVIDIANLSSDLEKLKSLKTRAEIIDAVVNDLIFRLGYIASAIFMLENNRLYMRGLTLSNISEKVLHVLPGPLTDLYIDYISDRDNLTVKALRENKYYITDHTRDYVTPLVESYIADKVQEISGDCSNIIFPLIANNKKIGAIVYVTKYNSDFSTEWKILNLVSDEIAQTLSNAAD